MNNDEIYKFFPRKRALASHLSSFRQCRIKDARKHLLKQDVIYVGGGSTANMLAIWRVHGIDHILRDAWKSGVILTGISAGMLCWFKQGRALQIPLDTRFLGDKVHKSRKSD
jgi:dipeptidase E